MRPRTLFVALLIIECLVLDFVCGRILTHVLPDFHEFSRAREVRIPSSVYHHDLKPLTDGMGLWGSRRYPLRTNSLGFRDSAVREVPIKTDKKRILFIGDSFTEGVGVEFDNTFFGILRRHYEERGIEALNAGVVSYLPIIYYRKIRYLLETVGLEFDRVVVFLDNGDVNDSKYYFLDENENVRVRPKDGPARSKGKALPAGNGLKRFLKENSMVFRLIAAFTRTRRMSNHEWRTLEHRMLVGDGQTADFSRMGEVVRYMNLLSNFLQDRGIRMTLAVYPYPVNVYKEDLNSGYTGFWKDWASDHGADFVDYYPYFVREGEGAEAFRRFYIPNDAHWNKEGHARVAKIFLEKFPVSDL